MLRVKDRQRVPPGGYHYTEPATGARFSAHTIGRVVADVRKHRIANHLTIPDNLVGVVEDSYCQDHPEWCEDVPGTAPPLAVQATNFVKAVWRWGKSGFKMVDQGVFDHRASVCASCPHFQSWSEIGIGRCNLCGCPSGRVSIKLWMATEKCPDNPPRW